jgi:aminodeoxyfutalosine deaminase
MNAMSATAENPVAVRARWILPVDRPPIEGGIVTLAAGKIVAVGENQSGSSLRDLGDVALLPGLVNAHTHLEFSLLDQPLGEAGLPFPNWIGRVVEYRRSQAKALMVETDGFQRFRRRAAQRGLAELQAAAAVAVGEIATPDWPRECFPAAGLSTTLFLELLGLSADVEESLKSAKSFLDEVLDLRTSLRPGLSPHAPYTVSPDLVRGACALSAQERIPVAMHLAESREELELLASHAGPLVEVLQSLGAWHPNVLPRGLRPLDYLEMLATAHRALVIHGNYLAADEVEFLAAHHSRMSLVYCPRTHAYFGHEAYPLAQFLKAGVRVAVGTDSRASNPDLSLWRELQHIARHHPDVSPEAILRMGTLAGAEALGIVDHFGTISPGKSSRLAVVRLADAASPYDGLFSSASGSVRPLAQSAA